jgi:fluoroacetyl-CoA thioesterase
MILLTTDDVSRPGTTLGDQAMIHIQDSSRRFPSGRVLGRSVFFRGMPAKLDIGNSYSLQSRVEEWMTAEKAGNPGVDVLATSVLVQLVENAAIHCLAPMLRDGQISLGTHVELEHRQPVPVGFIVRVEVEVVHVDGPRVGFAVRVFDEQELVAEGTHERYLIDRTKFLAKLEEKLA